MPTALILGITGQDGSYLAELLLSKGYDVHGVIRRASNFNTHRIDPIFDRLTLYYGDVNDPLSIRSALTRSRPDEVYNLAAQSHVKTSFEIPVYTCETGAIGALHCLEAIRDYRDSTGHNVRFYQASSSEMFGHPPTETTAFHEDTPFRPRSPYACAKVFAFHAARNYREAYGLHICNGILFNHESPRRGETFVTRKITRAAARIKAGLQDSLRLGNLHAYRDWGFAGDYVEAMWLMLQQDQPDDYVVATGRTIQVRQWLDMAFAYFDLDPAPYVHVDTRYLRPTDVEYLCGDPAKIERVTGWTPKTSVSELCNMMCEADYAEVMEGAKQRHGLCST